MAKVKSIMELNSDDRSVQISHYTIRLSQDVHLSYKLDYRTPTVLK